MKQGFQSRIASLERELKAKKEAEVEHEKMVKSLENEKSVLSAAVAAREGKLIAMSELQKQTELLSKQVEERDLLKRDLVRRCMIVSKHAA